MPPNCDMRELEGEDRLRGIKGRNIFKQMLNSSSIHHTANMKLLLLTSVICFAAVAAAPADKQKRDILPGDPRYGTDHHHHHHHDHENEVQITKAIGGYAGSYTVPDTEVHLESFQVPNPTYGPPSHKPGKPIGDDYLAPVADTIKSSVQVPSTSYGIPDITQINNNYLAPVEDKKTPLTEATEHIHILNTDYQAPSAEAPITSYGLPSVKSEEHVHVSQTSYGTPVVKTTIHEQPKHETVHLQKTVVPEVHHVHTSQPVVHKHVETSNIVPQVKVLSRLPETQVTDFQHTSIPSFTSFGSSALLPSVYTSYPTSYINGYRTLGSSSIPVKTVDHHVHVQVPQPYPVPITKQVTYPVPVPHTVEVPRPYYVRVPQPVRVTVNRPYPVEVPRAVPYPVPHYVRTNVPVPQPVPVLQQQQQHHVVETVKANPIQSFFDNTASTFQDSVSNLPSFTNPLEGFQNVFENFQNPFENFQPSLPALPSLPSLPALPALPSLPSFTPSQSITGTAPTAPAADHVDVSAPSNDAISIENPTIKSPTPVSKTVHTQHTVKTTTQKEYVQPTDENGGYVY